LFYRRTRREQRRDAMHPLFSKAANLTQTIIGAAIEVHRDKGPGLVESIYEWCLTKELELRRLESLNQKIVRVRYKTFVREEPCASTCS
jgi:hypothetical protein